MELNPLDETPQIAVRYPGQNPFLPIYAEAKEENTDGENWQI